MNNKIKKISSSKIINAIKILICPLLFLSFGACKKLVEIPLPTEQLVAGTVFNNEQTAQSAVIGIYSQMYNKCNAFNGNITSLTAMTSDELYYFPNNSLDQFKNNSILTNNILVDSLWSDAYGIIYQANAVIEGLNRSAAVGASLKNQLTAEAKTLRAFCYFNLVNLFGDVPLVLQTDVNISSAIGRTPKADVYQQMITDLKDAEAMLPANYAVSGNERTRVNKYCADALLARIYLFQGQWADAENYASRVLDNTTLYALPFDLSKVFLKNSEESIWQFNTTASSTDGFTKEGAHFIPGGQNPNYVLTSFILNAFEQNDQRKAQWTNAITYNEQSFSYPFKYRSPNSATGGEYYTVLRLAEQYLIRAEARAALGNITGAQSDLNAIRQRAGLTNTTAASTPSLLLAIEHERQTELFCEWGHRWFDLVRTKRADAVLGKEKPGFWKPTAALFPVPSLEINRNPKLTPNPGY